MTDKTAGDFFTAKHARLTLIASMANLFAWIIFIVFVLSVLAKFIEVQNSYITQIMYSNLGQTPDFMKMLADNPLYAASFIVNLVSIFLQGVIYGLILKGISLGLNMIVETNLNYNEKFPGASNE